jgi:phosphatidylglycerophosphate synthase
MNKTHFTLPNVLSLSRALLLPLLYYFVLRDMPTAFLISYIIVGSTDFFDGYLARKLNMTSELGKALDSIADVFFYVSTAWFVHRLFPHYLGPNNNLMIAFFAIFFLSFAVSWVRCGKPIMMHTFLLKLNGVMVYLLVIASFFVDTTGFIALIFAIYLLGFTEEIVIFLKYGEVDPDTPTLWHLMKTDR